MFDREAERYDRCRPTYPAALIDDLVSSKPEGLKVLVVGCGSGIASFFGAPTQRWFPWTQTYHRDQWLEQLLSRSDHTALDPAVRDRLFEAIGSTIDDFGGSFVMNFETVLITATRLP